MAHFNTSAEGLMENIQRPPLFFLEAILVQRFFGVGSLSAVDCTLSGVRGGDFSAGAVA